MQVKKHRDSDRSGGDMLEADGLRKNSSCFSNIKIFLISECALMLAQGTVGAYLVSVLTTLERRFNLQSADVGVIASSFEIGNLALILFVSYFGAKAHRPRLIGCGGIVMALGALLSALPEFLTNQYEIGDMRRTDVGRDDCSNTSSRDAQQIEDTVCANRANTNMMYLLLIGAQVLLGIGATPVQPLGVSYIDDHVKKKDSSLYIGILFSTLVFGPACGFILGSVCTKFYVDAIFIDTSKLGITPDDPRWIGAWWAGFLLCGALLFCSALFMFGFPQSLPTKEREEGADSEQVMLPPSLNPDYETPKPSNGVVHNHEPANSPTCCQQLRVIPKVTKHLLSNPVFTCIILAACMEIAVVAGFAAFLGKYLEQQFNLTTTSANQLLGMTAIPCACLGIFMGGLLVKKLNLSALGAIRMAMLVNLISTACYVSFLFLGCDTGPVAGVTVKYGNETLQPGEIPKAQCISHCNCFTSSISPVCGSNGITYLSACFAGCTRTGSAQSTSNISQNLTGCACISADNNSATAVPGKCPTPGCQEAFLIFLCVICACSLVGAMAQTPSVIILIRTVSPELKSYALGVLFLLLRLLGFIPPPLIFGAGIDSTCLFWSSDCGEKGACLLYNNVAYRHLYVSLAIILKGIAFLLYTTTWLCLRGEEAPPSDSPTVTSPAPTSKPPSRTNKTVRIVDRGSEECMFAKDLPSFLVPSPGAKPDGAELKSRAQSETGVSESREEGEERGPYSEEKPSPFGIKLRRTNYSLRFHSEQSTEKRKKRYSAGDSFDGVPSPLTPIEPDSDTSSVFSDKSSPASPHKEGVIGKYLHAAASPAIPRAKPVKSTSSTAHIEGEKVLSKPPLYRRPTTSPKPTGAVPTPPPSPLPKAVHGPPSDTVIQRTGAIDSSSQEQTSRTEEPSAVAHLHRSSQGQVQGEEEPKEKRSFFPSINIPWREKVDRKTELIRREKPSLQSRHSLDSARVQEKEAGPLWITLALQKQKGFREQQQNREERRSQREAKLAEKHTRERDSVSPTESKGSGSTSPSSKPQTPEEPKRPDSLLGRLERRENLKKANTLPSSVTVEIADSTPSPPAVKEVSKRFPSSDSPQVSTEPAWLALAKRKAKAWSDCPQIIK